MMEQIRFLPCGDCAVTVEFSRVISEETNRRIRFLAESIRRQGIRGVRETVPTFCSLTIYFDPLVISGKTLEKRVRRIVASDRETASETRRIFLIPVCYEGEYAPDMEDVCSITGLTREQVVARHSSVDYRIYMLGFLPGFPYLGGMDPRLEVPRLESPRTAIPAGAVGIGGKQTGIYPMASPGGWRLIGRTPWKVYDPARADPIVYRAGDYIRFYPINQEAFREMTQKGVQIQRKEEPI